MAHTVCKHCAEPMEFGQLGSCLWFLGQLYTGHYLCVLDALGPEATLRAIQAGVIPMIDPASLVHHRLPQHQPGAGAPIIQDPAFMPLGIGGS